MKLTLIAGCGLAFSLLIQFLTWRQGCVVCAYIGLPGMLIDLLIEGAHGGNHIEVLVGEIVSTLINSLFFGSLLLFFLRHWVRD
jgi:hypothetical protein